MVLTKVNEVNKILSFNLDVTSDNEFIINIKANNIMKEVRLFIGSEELTFDLKYDTFSYMLAGMPNIKEEIKAFVTFKDNEIQESSCSLRGLYSSKAFNKKYYYEGELGAIYSPLRTTFRVWSPISTSITLRIYNNGTPVALDNTLGSDEFKEYRMEETECGVFEATIDGDLEGKYYTYVVNSYKYKNKEIADPYTKSCGLNGVRGMVVDFSKTNPEGWDKVKLNGLKDRELVVYESHIADLTSSKTWGGKKENSRKFKGFYEEGTRYTHNGVTVSTGFDHIKELGVNTVQLLPIFKHNIDERPGHEVFNWGYDPTLYNALDGIYSNNPYDGYERIKEFKCLVMAYLKAGINIIMDVVYNHMDSLKDNPFEILMPEYYFRYKDSIPLDGSACGNETSSDMLMYRKFMIDSTEFWASEYKLAGFRFDLMGLHDIETMNLLTQNLKARVNPRITVYGEPWNAGSVGLGYHEAAVQRNMNSYVGFGCFNDKMRDALIKGGICNNNEKGFVNEEGIALREEIADIKAGLKGLVLKDNSVHEVNKCVNYVTCHDNFTLYDRFIAAGEKDYDKIKKMAILAQSINLTSQGIAFILSGEEMLRSKGGSDNSYNLSFEVNELDYSLKAKNLDLFKIYQALIALHNETSLFNKNSEDSKNIRINISNDDNTIYYELTDSINNRLYKIAHRNGYMRDSLIKLDFEGYKLYLSTIDNNIKLDNKTRIRPFETIIAYKSL